MTMISNQKLEWMDEVSSIADAMQNLLDRARAVSSFFHDNGMGSGGDNELVDADMDGTRYAGVTAAEMTAAGVTVQEAFATWYDGAQMPIMAVVKKAP